MRFAFWKAKPSPASATNKRATWFAGRKAAVSAAPAMAEPEPVVTAPVASLPRAEPAATTVVSGDLDLRAIGRELYRKKNWIIVPTAWAFVLALVVVNLITPRYQSEARILVDGRENVFLRANAERPEERNTPDPEAVTSQVQLLLSRDLARAVIAKNKLAEMPEFDPVLRGINPFTAILGLLGIVRDPFKMTPEERVLDSYFDRLQAFAVDKSRVIVVEFQSWNPELAARVANSIAEQYLVMQQDARQQQAKAASQWLEGEIDNMRKRVAEAESRAEDFRSKSNLFIGTNNTSLSNQQMGELNTQLNNARAQKSDAESKSRLIREMLQSGRPIEASEVLNSELIRRLSEQRVTLRAQLAEQSSTLLDGHPRIKELRAQINDLDRQIREEAGKLSRSLDNDARIAGARVEGLSNNLEQLKRQAGSANGQDVQLRALEREAKAQRDLLESYLAKYREATARESLESSPAESRIISRALVSNTPAYPKKVPIVLIATLATLLLSVGIIVTGELMRLTAPRPAGRFEPVIAAQPMQTPAAYAPVAPAPVVQAPVMTAAPVAPAMATPAMHAPAAQPPVAAPITEPRVAARDNAPSVAATPSGLEKLANELRAASPAMRKVTVLGSGEGASVAVTALTLARLLARGGKTVLVDLSASSPVIASAVVDPQAPGLAELMQGKVSFGEIISRDRLSRLHIVGAGRPGFDRAVLQLPRLALALDALSRVYDHIVLDAGKASDLPAALLTAQARAVVVPEPSMSAAARDEMAEQLKAVGFDAVTMLDRASVQAEAEQAATAAAA